VRAVARKFTPFTVDAVKRSRRAERILPRPPAPHPRFRCYTASLGSAPMDEEALIDAVVRVRSASAEPLTAAQVHKALTDEGVGALEFSAVKKACSKAAKRMPPVDPAAAASEQPAKPSKKEEKAAKAAAGALAAAEGVMMNALKRLQNRHNLNSRTEVSADKAFLERAVQRAITGSLDPGETICGERVAADKATLEWILHPGCSFELPAEQRTAATTQLQRLRDNEKK
jgi:hypothetical protein